MRLPLVPLVVVIAWFVPDVHADGIVFPADAGVLNVKDFGAKGDGRHDDTAAIQALLNAHPNEGRILYFPAGTYLISNTLRWPHGQIGGWEEKRTVVQGQDRAKSILKLKDACDGYTDKSSPRAMIWTGSAPAQRFGNAIRDLTIDTGKKNDGAIGLQFDANNQGCVRDVTIRSGDGKALTGLDMAYSDEIGPLLVKNVKILGFDYGIRTAHAVDSMTFEHITLQNQNRFAFVNEGQCVSVRDLKTTGPVPGLVNSAGIGLVTLVDSSFSGRGKASGKPAVENAGFLFARNVTSTTFAETIHNTATATRAATRTVEEFTSHPPLALGDPRMRSLNLEIKETPEIPWDPLESWASPTHFGAKPDDDQDDTEAIQKAIDSGKSTVYFPCGLFQIRDTILVRGAVRRLIGCEATIDVPDLKGKPAFKIVDGTSPVVVFERLSSGYSTTPTLDNASKRTLVIKDCCNVCGTMTGPGDVFIEDVCANPFTNFQFKGQNVWARQLNVENEGTHVVNDGGNLWILGFKTERGGTLIETKNGGKTEVLGGFCYTTTAGKLAPMFVNDESYVSVVIGESCFTGDPYTILVRETLKGATRELKRGEAPERTGGSVLPLYSGAPKK